MPAPPAYLADVAATLNPENVSRDDYLAQVARASQPVAVQPGPQSSVPAVGAVIAPAPGFDLAGSLGAAGLKPSAPAPANDVAPPPPPQTLPFGIQMPAVPQATGPFGLNLQSPQPMPVLAPGSVAPAREPLGAMPNAPTPPSAAPTAPTATQTETIPPTYDPGSFPLSAVPGGGRMATIPAKETELRGPSVLRAQAERNAAVQGAIDTVRARNEVQTAAEVEAARGQVQAAGAREDAIAQANAERQEELEQRQKDVDQTVKGLSQMSHDPDGGFWGSRTAFQKISSLTAMTLGGFLQGARGGSNPGVDMINTTIDRYVRAQEAQYQAAKDKALTQNTAFGLALDKYKNLDAARAMARAAAIDSVQSQLAELAARKGGVDNLNAADRANAALQDEKMRQIEQGIAFTPARQVMAPRQYVDENGLVYSESEAKGLAKDLRTQRFELGKQELGQEGGYRAEVLKAMLAKDGKADEGAKYISEKLQAASIPETRQAAEAARLALTANPYSQSERLTRALPDGIPASAVIKSPAVHQAVFGENAAHREQAWETYKLHAIKAIAGTRGESSPGFAERAKAMLDGAGDNAARLKAIEFTEAGLDQAEKAIRAGASTASQKKYDAQKASAETGGPDAQPKFKTFKPEP